MNLRIDFGLGSIATNATRFSFNMFNVNIIFGLLYLKLVMEHLIHFFLLFLPLDKVLVIVVDLKFVRQVCVAVR